MRNKMLKFVCFCLLFTLNLGCENANNNSKNNSDISTKEVTINKVENETTNAVFSQNNCKMIRYWIMGKGIEITDKNTVDGIMDILISTRLEEKSMKEERAGGIDIDLINDKNEEKRLVLYSDSVLYDNQLYMTGEDIVEQIRTIVEQFANANGYGSYFEEKTYENRGKLKLK
ncbi:hypothetical protein [Eubacterium sp.]